MIDPYLYPGTDVLRNKEHITDARELEAFERMATANRMETLPDDIPVTVGARGGAYFRAECHSSLS